MKAKLSKILTADGLETTGFWCEPEESTKKIVIYTHGMNGNFYENAYVNVLAETLTRNGWAFLAFNNRGKDYVAEFRSNDKTILVGGCLEKFVDTVKDFDGVMTWVKEKGYKEIVLVGHSYGCNKVAYYYAKQKEKLKAVKKIILLAPCDVARLAELGSGELYHKNLAKAEKLVTEGREKEMIHTPMAFAEQRLSANTMLDFRYDTENDIFRYRNDEKTRVLENIDIPVLVVFGSKDKFVYVKPKEGIVKYLKHSIDKCDVAIIDGAGHSYYGKDNELAGIVKKFVLD